MSKGVYIEKKLKQRTDYRLYEYTSLIRMNYYKNDTLHPFNNGFEHVVVNKVPIVSDSVGKIFEVDFYPGKLNFIVLTLGYNLVKFKLKLDLKYQYDIKVVMKELEGKKGELL